MTGGFSLIECLIGIGLIALLVMSSHASMTAIATATDDAAEEALLLQEAILVRELIRDELGAGTVIEDAATDALVLNQDHEISRFVRSGASLILEHASTVITITTPATTVETFTARARTGELEIALQLAAQARSGRLVSRTFEYKFPL